MTILFFAYLRDPEFAGCKTVQWRHVKTLRELGEELCGRFGSKFRAEFFSPDGKELGERVIVMVNGRRSEFLKGLDTELKDEDTVQVFPVVAGG